MTLLGSASAADTADHLAGLDTLEDLRGHDRGAAGVLSRPDVPGGVGGDPDQPRRGMPLACRGEVAAVEDVLRATPLVIVARDGCCESELKVPAGSVSILLARTVRRSSPFRLAGKTPMDRNRMPAANGGLFSTAMDSPDLIVVRSSLLTESRCS